MSTNFTNVWGRDDWSDEIRLALIRQSALLSAVGPTPVDGKLYHKPRVAVYPTAQWVAELATFPTDAGTSDVLTYQPKKIGDSTVISNECIEDSTPEQLTKYAESLMRGLSKSIDETAFGTGAATSTAPQGLLHGLTAVDATGGTSGSAISLDDILDAITDIQTLGGNADVAFINGADLKALRKIKSTTGEYIWAPGNSVTGDLTRVPNMVFGGVTFYISPGIAAGSLLVADSQFLTVAMNRDIGVDFDPSAAFLEDGVAARVSARLDFGIEDDNAVVLLQTV